VRPGTFFTPYSSPVKNAFFEPFGFQMDVVKIKRSSGSRVKLHSARSGQENPMIRGGCDALGFEAF
jgi:hypothetical protein